tara:strand:- start:1099 stop:1437 length:339 start_codon:yes stop_codon:yes gene_type:complete
MSNKAQFTALQEIIALFRAMDRAFPLQYISCLLIIAEHPGLSVSELARKSGIKLPTVSRIIGTLSHSRQKGAGFELIEIANSPEQRRSKTLRLSKKGEDLCAKISSFSQKSH